MSLGCLPTWPWENKAAEDGAGAATSPCIPVIPAQSLGLPGSVGEIEWPIMTSGLKKAQYEFVLPTKPALAVLMAQHQLESLPVFRLMNSLSGVS